MNNFARRQFSIRKGTGIPFGLIAALAIVVLFVTPIVIVRATATHVTFTVEDKEAVATRDDNGGTGHKYMIFTDRGVYQDTDSIAFFKFNSADVYGQLKRDHTYDCLVTGFRIPILSATKNIIHCEEK